MPPVPAPRVVKLGGSLCEDPQRLRALLAAVRAACAGGGPPCIVVPGGGIFSGAVHSAQQRLGYSDAAAHAMAILAMRQTGIALCDIGGLPGAAGLEGVRTQLAAGAPACIWLPDEQRDARELECSWRVGADSLALWMAARLGAPAVVLVKSCARPSLVALPDLALAAVVDPIYAEMSATLPSVHTRFVFDADPAALRAALAASI